MSATSGSSKEPLPLSDQPPEGKTLALSPLLVETPLEDFSFMERAPYWAKPEREMDETKALPAGQTMKLECRANGFPEPQLTWFKDGEELTASSLRPVPNSLVLSP